MGYAIILYVFKRKTIYIDFAQKQILEYARKHETTRKSNVTATTKKRNEKNASVKNGNSAKNETILKRRAQVCNKRLK